MGMCRLRLAKSAFIVFLWGLCQASAHGAQSRDALYEAAMETEAALNAVMLNATFAGERMVVVGERGHILLSDNDGETWFQATVPVRTALTAVHFISPQRGWAVGHDTVILTTADGGVTWTKLLDGNRANQLILASAQKRLTTVQAQLAQADASERRHLQYQLDFAEIALDEAQRDADIGPNKVLMDVWFADEKVGLVIGASGYMLRTVDGGKNWQDWSDRIDNLDLMHLYALEQNQSGTLFLLGEAGSRFRSIDQGASWQPLELPYEGSLFGILAKPDSDDVFAFGMSGVIYKSTDNGDSWELVPSNTKSILQAGAIGPDGRAVLVGLGGVLLQEDASGAAFFPVALGGRSAMTVVLGRKNGGLLVAGETGLRVFAPHAVAGSSHTSTTALQNIGSLRFMFNKRNID